jgi:hypothetical protein
MLAEGLSAADERVGSVDHIVVTPDEAVSHAIMVLAGTT